MAFMQRAGWMRTVIFLLTIGAVMGAVISFATYVGVEKTAGADFCGSCHTMRPFVESYRLNIHGGSNPFGVKAECADCHLPHNSLPYYLFAKARTGLNDIWVESFRDTSKIDWSEKSENPRSFVYDSGCLKCHGNLQDKTLSNPRAFLPHRAYFAKTIKKTCADCHSHMGHRYLAEFIKR
jgi:cytochrome c-type protein NapC